MGKLTYEECRLKRLKENKKRMEALRLPQLSHALQKSHKSSSMKQAKSRTDQTQMAAVRRSRRVANQTAPVYVEDLPRRFCKDSLPRRDEVMTLVDEECDEYPTVYLAGNTRLSSGWKGFAVVHDLVDGDALVFELIRPTKFKVHIIRAKGFEQGNKL